MCENPFLLVPSCPPAIFSPCIPTGSASTVLTCATPIFDSAAYRKGASGVCSRILLKLRVLKASVERDLVTFVTFEKCPPQLPFVLEPLWRWWICYRCTAVRINGITYRRSSYYIYFRLPNRHYSRQEPNITDERQGLLSIGIVWLSSLVPPVFTVQTCPPRVPTDTDGDGDPAQLSYHNNPECGRFSRTLTNAPWTFEFSLRTIAYRSKTTTMTC
ncbi:hypothetical protein DFH94DRAFT_725465 [Russula ochroleuca]|uniref:Uncharacterized protein n=1 Tax=Russula ochroleuca TaxID=152965 RepID=A0A9P5TBS2_9AGAM|nr:hypothetical protein DFH94DRAFT_725465 [Russula ochroleuca]